MNLGVLNHLLQSKNLGKVLLAEILVKTVVEKFDNIQQFKIQLSKWKVIFFFTIFLFEKCLLGIDITWSTWTLLKWQMNLIVPCWGSLCLQCTYSLPIPNFTPWPSLQLGTALSVFAVQWSQMIIFPSREICSEERESLNNKNKTQIQKGSGRRREGMSLIASCGWCLD